MMRKNFRKYLTEAVMKLKIVFLILFFACGMIKGQVAENSWNIGFGFSYPRLMAINPASNSLENNYGAFLSLQRKFTENSGLRLRSAYGLMRSEYVDAIRGTQEHEVGVFSFNLDYTLNLFPCQVISPYLVAGVGGIVFSSDNSPIPKYDDTFTKHQINLGIGTELRLSSDINIKAEFQYHTPSTNNLDGINDEISDKGLFGGSSDTYMTLDLGLKYYFAQGDPSKECDLYEGVKEVRVDTVVKYKSKEVIKEVVVEKPVTKIEKEWVLVGVNFDFDKYSIQLEAHPNLIKILDFLDKHPDLGLEIQGHTDNIGSEGYNKKLSVKRAERVKKYLVNKGISPDRLKTVGYGENKPVADNKTKLGRYLNRRIVFKVLD